MSRDVNVVRRRIRQWLAVFVFGLVASGLTAFPLETETGWLVAWIAPWRGQVPALAGWIERVHAALADTGTRYPFLAYGTDWLAFAHLVIAAAFWGPWRDPVRNAWVIDWAILACAGVVPLALACGAVRGIPLYWRLIDISFGALGVVPLIVVRRDIRALERWDQRGMR
jgi:hypothetical protein